MSKWRTRTYGAATGIGIGDSRLHDDTFEEISRHLFGRNCHGTTEPDNICRLAYSLAARRAFASLFDTDEEDHDYADGIVTLHHFKKVFRNIFEASFSLWPVKNRPNTDEMLDTFYDASLRAGLVWHKPERAVSPRFTFAVFSNEEKTRTVVLLRGFGPGIETRMSGALPWVQSRDESWPAESELSPDDYLSISPLSPQEIFNRCVRRVTIWKPHRPNEKEQWDYLVPYRGGVVWRRQPAAFAHALARLTRETGEKEYFLLAAQLGERLESRIPLEMIRLMPSLKIGFLLSSGETPVVKVRHSCDGLTNLEWRILPTIPLRNVFAAASFPSVSVEKTTPYRQTVATAIYEILRPYLLQAGFRTEIQE